MNDFDFGNFIGEAIDKLEPRNDAEKEKFARLKERMAAINEETRIEIEKAKAEIDTMLAPKFDKNEILKIAAERSEIANSFLTELRDNYLDQAVTIHRIANAIRLV